MNFFKRIFCSHNDDDLEFVRNVYGDEINWRSGKNIVRSIWVCKNCGKTIYKSELYETK